jgi:GGDEF domain-containing protein
VTATEGWWHRLDHYYFLTAFLAGRGKRVAVCRVVAAMMAGLGLICLGLNWSPFGPKETYGQVIAIAVALCCWAMAVVWLKPRWPSITVSRTCVVLGIVCIAAECLVQSNPMAGLFGATAFGLVAAHAAFFHTLRLLWLCWTVAALTLAVLVTRLAPTELVLALCAALLVGLIVGFVSFTGRATIWMIDADILHPDLEPLTGLLNHDGFYEKAATLVGARSRDDDRFLMVAVINLDGFSLLGGLGGDVAVERARVEIARRLRETARQDAVLAHPFDSEFLLADVFTTLDASPLIDRVHGAIKSAPARLTASIGVVCTPLQPLIGQPAHDVLDEIVTLATNAMYQARKGGGNQIRYVHDPSLTVLDQPPADA